ncbi:MAG TPA: 5-dehydro-4-deoxyglucarate dehydratase [Bryobacteraceae bacterium]|jgi:5-dehydro-4-deoxyglucarate dehydratase|nr:5-dehydro-4-deoxyglucarate dehydratase [Bryobacteraceae bacterium]
MTNRQFTATLRGVFGFPVTPFKKDFSLDLATLERNVDRMAQFPFCALVAAGGTGEMYSLSVDEIEQIVALTVKTVNGRMPVVAGTGFNAVLGVEIAKRAERAGAQAILALPPYYIQAPEDGLFSYYQAIGQSTTLPLIVYSRDWAVFTPDMVARLADRVPTLAAWKEGQGDIRRYQRIMNYNGDRLAWYGGLGDDCVPGYFAVGVQAFTSSLSNLAPQVSLALADAGLTRDWDRLSQLMQRYVHPLYALRERARGYEVAMIKEAMEMLGLPAGPVRPPLMASRPRDLEDLRLALEPYRDLTASGRAVLPQTAIPKSGTA